MKLKYEFSVEDVAVLDAALFSYQRKLVKCLVVDDPDDPYIKRIEIIERLSDVLLNQGEVIRDGK